MRSLLLDRPAAYLRWLDYPGDDLPIVFIHGLGCASTIDYPRVIAGPELAGHRFVLPDLLGHGYSDAPRDFDYTIRSHAETVSSLLVHLDISRAVIFGHSMGGSVAVELTAMWPELAEHLVLCESNIVPGGGIVSTGIASQSEEAFLAGGHAALVQWMLDQGWVSRAATFHATDSVGLHRSAVSLVAGSDPTWGEQFHAMKMPRTWIVGAKSNPQNDINAHSPHGIPVYVVPNAGHDMAFENPDGLAEILARALAGA